MITQTFHDLTLATRGRGLYPGGEHRTQPHTRRVTLHFIGE